MNLYENFICIGDCIEKLIVHTCSKQAQQCTCCNMVSLRLNYPSDTKYKWASLLEKVCFQLSGLLLQKWLNYLLKRMTCSRSPRLVCWEREGGGRNSCCWETVSGETRLQIPQVSKCCAVAQQLIAMYFSRHFKLKMLFQIERNATNCYFSMHIMLLLIYFL